MNVPALRALCLALLLVLAGCSGFVGDGPSGSATGDGPNGSATNGPTEAPVQGGTGNGSPDGARGDLTTPDPDGSLSVHVIDVGQSTSTLLVAPSGETMLVDSGDFADDGEHVLAYLRAHGIERIDYLVTTHNDADHIGGHAAVIEYYETQAEGVGAVYDPGIAASTRTYEEYLDAVEAHDVPLYELREGDRLPFGGERVRTQVFGPPEPYLAGEERNENSVVLRVAHGETSFLLPGDAGEAQESYLVETYGDRLDSTVLLAGHHGSSTSTSAALLDAVSPRLVVVSSAYDSRYGHPHEEVLDRLADRPVPTYWTGTHGDVLLRTNGEVLAVSTQQAAPTDAAALREGSPSNPASDAPLTLRELYGAGGARETAGGSATPAGTGTPVVTDGGTDGEDGSNGSDGAGTGDPSALTVSEVHADAAGDDGENLNDEYVVLTNRGDEPVDLSGFRLADEAGATYVVPDGVELAPGASLTLHTGSGTDTATDRYWGRSSPVWNNDGDTVILTAPDGTVVLRETYR